MRKFVGDVLRVRQARKIICHRLDGAQDDVEEATAHSAMNPMRVSIANPSAFPACWKTLRRSALPINVALGPVQPLGEKREAVVKCTER